MWVNSHNEPTIKERHVQVVFAAGSENNLHMAFFNRWLLPHRRLYCSASRRRTSRLFAGGF